MNFSANEKDSSKHALGIVAVILLHVAIVYALLTGLGREMVEMVRKPVQVSIVEQTKPPPEIQPIPPRASAPPKSRIPLPAFVPQAEVKVETQPQPNMISASPVSEPPAPEVSLAQAKSDTKGPVRIAAVVDSSKCGKPAYPGISLRNEEQGTVTLAFLIGVDGTVLDSKVQKSSGYQELDKAARIGLSLCKFKPATVDGVPEQSWTKMQYVWKLE